MESRFTESVPATLHAEMSPAVEISALDRTPTLNESIGREYFRGWFGGLY